MKYISKGEWFYKGTEAVLIDDYRKSTPPMDSGLFRGWRQCETPTSENKPLKFIYEDEEVCGFDEFDVVDDDYFVGDSDHEHDDRIL